MARLGWDDVVRLSADLPEIEVATSYGTAALRVRKKSIVRMWSEREHARDGVDAEETEVLVVLSTLEEKEALLAAHGDVLFETPHYSGYGAFLVRLADVDEDLLGDLIENAYRFKAPKSLVAQLDP